MCVRYIFGVNYYVGIHNWSFLRV